MQKKLFILVIILVNLFSLIISAQASDIKNLSEKSYSTFSASKDTRIIKVRGKRYKVWYKVSYKRGKRIIQIIKVKPI